MKNYSQNNEQQIILDFFQDFAGTFMDIGANTGIDLSNTWFIANTGWQGTLVEPSPIAFKRLQANYEGKAGFDLLEVAVDSYNGHIEFWESGEHLGNGDVALVSTTNRDELTRWKKENFRMIPVKCVDFRMLLSMTSHRNFDLISIDIEGSEWQVVPQINFQALGTKMAIIEYNGHHREYFDRILFRQGFHLHAKNRENLIYVR